MMAKQEVSATKRLRQIVNVISKNHFLANFYHQTNPEVIVAALEELGPTFIKLGQLLSTRPDLVSPSYISALETLQDQVQEDDFDTVKTTIEESTGQTLAELFADFEKHPFASASIGQCHRAHLHDGTEVVVKVQHPAVRQLVEVDLALFTRAVRLLKYVPEGSVVDLPQVVEQLGQSLRSEIDFTIEAQATQRFYELNNGRGIFLAPKAFVDQSSSRVLVTQYMPGDSIKGLLADPPTLALPDGLSLTDVRKGVARSLVENFIQEFFYDRFFHADPHPGNLFFLPVPAGSTQTTTQFQKQFGDLTLTINNQTPLPPYRLVYLDFGMMGTLPASLAQGIAQVILAITTKDSYQISQAILRICNQTGPVDEQSFNHQLASFLRPYLNTGLKDYNFSQMIFEVTSLCHRNHLQVKPEVTMLLRAFGTLEGTVAKLDPSISLMDIARPFAKQYFKEHFNPKHFTEGQALKLLRAAGATTSIPIRMATFLEQLTNGEQRLNLHYQGQDRVLAKLEALLNRLLTVIVLAAIILASSILVVGGTTHPLIYKLGVSGYLLAIISLLGLVIANTWRRFHR